MSATLRGTHGDVTDPYVATGPYRTLRGGAWSGIPIYTRSASRGGNDPTVVNFNYGFRVVLAPTIQ